MSFVLNVLLFSCRFLLKNYHIWTKIEWITFLIHSFWFFFFFFTLFTILGLIFSLFSIRIWCFYQFFRIFESNRILRKLPYAIIFLEKWKKKSIKSKLFFCKDQRNVKNRKSSTNWRIFPKLKKCLNFIGTDICWLCFNDFQTIKNHFYFSPSFFFSSFFSCVYVKHQLLVVAIYLCGNWLNRNDSYWIWTASETNSQQCQNKYEKNKTMKKKKI